MNHQLIVMADGALPIHLQLKEQIKWLIVEGHIGPGDVLPSVRDFSQTLGINRNTVNAVYDELRAEGLITMGRGRGTEVADTDKVRHLPRLKPLLRLIDAALAEAQQQGFSRDDIASAAQMRAQMLLAMPVRQGPVTFVECGEHELDFYVQQINELTGYPVRYLPLKELRENPSQAGELVVTTVFHAKEVRGLLSPEVTLAVVGALPVLRTIMELAQLPTGSQVAFVCRGMAGGLWMRGAVTGADLAHLHLEATGFREPHAQEVLERADVIYAAPSVLEQVKQAVKDPQRVRAFNMTLDATSRETLKAIVEKPER